MFCSFQRNEEELHESIRQLLAMTNQQDLRDKIIYILKDPKVDIGYRTDTSSKSSKYIFNVNIDCWVFYFCIIVLIYVKNSIFL